MNKLIRDKIPNIIRKNGNEPITHIASENEYWQKLKEKLQEETEEFIESENIEELADILEVVDAICAHKNLKKNDLANIKDDKNKERGGFSKRIILDNIQ